MKEQLRKLALIAVVGMAASGIALADRWDKMTTITTDESMQLPNMTLQPGTYVIRLDTLSDSNRHVVKFFDKDQKHLITTILAIPNERVRPTGKSVFSFWETPAGQPKALRAWFYPGDNFGQEFAYPKNEADRISAQNHNAKVPVNDEQLDQNSNTTAQNSNTQNNTSSRNLNNEPAPAPAAVASAPQHTPEAPAVRTAPTTPAPSANSAASANTNDDAQTVNRDRDDRATLSQNTPPPARTATPNTDNQNTNTQNTAPETLPKTASNLPVFGLLGLAALIGALALNFKRILS